MKSVVTMLLLLLLCLQTLLALQLPNIMIKPSRMFSFLSKTTTSTRTSTRRSDSSNSNHKISYSLSSLIRCRGGQVDDKDGKGIKGTCIGIDLGTTYR